MSPTSPISPISPKSQVTSETNPSTEKIYFTKLDVPESHPPLRKMTREGNVYVGDVDGDGTTDTFKCHFNANSRFGTCDHWFNDLEKNAYPKTFTTQAGKKVSLGDRVDVKNEEGKTLESLPVADWRISARNPSHTSNQPNYILVSIAFYTVTADRGYGDYYSIDSVL